MTLTDALYLAAVIVAAVIGGGFAFRFWQDVRRAKWKG